MILVGTQDFGPARYLFELTNNHKSEFSWIYSSSLASFFRENKIVTISKWNNLKNVKLVVTGTCLQEGTDKNLLIWAKQNKIPSVSCIDHWTLFKERFKLKNKTIYPDYIILNDKIALKLAIDEGLPRNKLFVKGNPVIEKLLSSKKSIISNKNINKKKRKILFISESLSYFKKGSCLYKGYTEYQVLQILINSLSSFDSVPIKKHPSERKNKYVSIMKIHGLKETTISNPKNLIKHFDIFVGMESMLLIQLSFMTNNTISLRPDAKKDFFANKIGLIKKAETKEDLQKLLKSNFIKQKIKSDKTRKNYLQSSKNIYNFLKKVSL